MSIKIYTDGASRGNPGKAGIGAIFYKKEQILDQISAYIGIKTNNEAEYLAVIRSLERLKQLGEKEAHFYCDSQLLVKQINGEYKVKAPKVIPLYKQVKELLKDINATFTWIRREQNSEADALANRGIDEQ